MLTTLSTNQNEIEKTFFSFETFVLLSVTYATAKTYLENLSDRGVFEEMTSASRDRPPNPLRNIVGRTCRIGIATSPVFCILG